ncbi:hypothetical protein V2I01_00685 [Micromonospora sp. BRA006-A]|nr:hypothetical protein [Micromonospora sp. BRA006-A]
MGGLLAFFSARGDAAAHRDNIAGALECLPTAARTRPGSRWSATPPAGTRTACSRTSAWRSSTWR